MSYTRWDHQPSIHIKISRKCFTFFIWQTIQKCQLFLRHSVCFWGVTCPWFFFLLSVHLGGLPPPPPPQYQKAGYATGALHGRHDMWSLLIIWIDCHYLECSLDGIVHTLDREGRCIVSYPVRQVVFWPPGENPPSFLSTGFLLSGPRVLWLVAIPTSWFPHPFQRAGIFHPCRDTRHRGDWLSKDGPLM